MRSTQEQGKGRVRCEKHAGDGMRGRIQISLVGSFISISIRFVTVNHDFQL